MGGTRDCQRLGCKVRLIFKVFACLFLSATGILRSEMEKSTGFSAKTKFLSDFYRIFSNIFGQRVSFFIEFCTLLNF